MKTAFEMGWSLENNFGVADNMAGDQFGLALMSEGDGPGCKNGLIYFDMETGEWYGEPKSTREGALLELNGYLVELGLEQAQEVK